MQKIYKKVTNNMFFNSSRYFSSLLILSIMTECPRGIEDKTYSLGRSFFPYTHLPTSCVVACW